MGLKANVVKSLFYAGIWKLRYGNGVKVGLPQGMEKVRMEKDKRAKIWLGEKIQNRGSLYLLCKGDHS